MLKILSSRELKLINQAFSKSWDMDIRLADFGYAYLLSRKNKVYAVTKEIGQIELDELNIDTMGIYLFYWDKKTLRLSIEGSQIFGRFAKKNIIDLDKDQMKDWLRGLDISLCLDDADSFHIIRYKDEYNDDYLGSGKIKDDTLLNFIPKNRRITSAD